MNIKTPAYFNSGARIALEIGTPLHLELGDVSIPLQSEFVGMEDNKCIIISAPSPLGSIKHKLFPGNQIIIKYLYNGTVYAFQTKIIETISKPLRLIFLEYPKIVQHKDLRNNKRMNCYFPVKLIINEEQDQGAILDINKNGCRCKVQEVTSERIATININDVVNMIFPFPGVEGEMDIEGMVTNVHKSNEGIDLGMIFHETSIESQKLIYQYIQSVYDYI